MRNGEGVHQRRRAIAAAWRLFDIVCFFVEDSLSFLFFKFAQTFLQLWCRVCVVFCCYELLASAPPLSCLFAVCTHDIAVVGSAEYQCLLRKPSNFPFLHTPFTV